MNAKRGWCPDAWHPMMAGDGLLMRIKPRLGRLTAPQVKALCEAAHRWGNGQIDVTRRANLQIRGVREAGWTELLERLIAQGLVDADPAMETRRNVLVAPDWRHGDDSHRIAGELLARLAEFPGLPAKVGFVVDAGPARSLASEPGDFRIERGEAGGLILRAAGRARGIAVARGSEVDGLIALARWFVTSGGDSAGRMRRHSAELPPALAGDDAPSPPAEALLPGQHALGAAYGAPFGRVDARTLIDAAPAAVRITAWRLILLEDARLVPVSGLIDDPADPLLRADACPGAPSCLQATVETRDLARQLAPFITGEFHVSGCAKGCARTRPAEVTITGRAGRYDLAFNATPGSPALHAALTEAELLSHLRAI